MGLSGLCHVRYLYPDLFFVKFRPALVPETIDKIPRQTVFACRLRPYRLMCRVVFYSPFLVCPWVAALVLQTAFGLCRQLGMVVLLYLFLRAG